MKNIFRQSSNVILNSLSNLQSRSSCFFTKGKKNTLTRIDIQDILYVQADGYSIKIVTLQSTYCSSTKLSSFCKQIKHPLLIWVHRSYVVNFAYIEEVGKIHIVVSQKAIPLGKTYREGFIQQLPRLMAD